MSRFSKTIVVLLLLAGAAYYWLLVNAGPASAPIRRLDIAQLRVAANAIPGDKPTSLEYAPIASRQVAGAALAAGNGLRQITSSAIAWRLDTPRGGIVIDSGLSQDDAAAMGMKQFDRRAQTVIGQWMDQAELIVFTHEHIDHVGGFLDYAGFRNIAAKAVFSPGLLRGMTSLWRENIRLLPKPRILAPVEAVAPGVVLIQTPGHTPASQMIFVQTKNGREYLFAGDTGSLANNIIQTTPRSRLLTDWLVKEDRAAVIGWLKGIKVLRKHNEHLVIIPSHDAKWIAATSGNDGFILPESLRQPINAK